MISDFRLALITSLLFCFANAATSQNAVATDTLRPSVKFFSLEPAPAFDKKRFRTVAATGAVAYTGLSAALWKAWYQDYPLSRFHPFNDWGEWEHMDKSGHLFSTWTACNYAFSGARWTGMSRRSAMWTAVGVGMGVMTTFEVMDGFSDEWGFSLADMGFNTLGSGLFVGQELLWQEQRIRFKVSGIRPGYPQEPLYASNGTDVTNLDDRAAGLYGTTFFHVLLKDYNALTVWATVNMHGFLPKETKFPSWLNLAVGYGANNIYGGFENRWETEDGAVFELDPVRYPRYRQFYLSPDIDLTKIRTERRWLKVTLGLLNFLKMPAPALELNSLGKPKFHWLHW